MKKIQMMLIPALICAAASVNLLAAEGNQQPQDQILMVQAKPLPLLPNTEIYQQSEDEIRSPTVIVVGGGLSGLITALKTQMAGHQTLLLEKQSQLGGTSLYTQGKVIVANSDFQANRMEESHDSPGKYKESLDSETDSTVDPELTSLLAECSGQVADWIYGELQLPHVKRVRPDWSGIDPRRIVPLKGRTHSLLEKLTKLFLEHGGQVLTDTTVVDLIEQKGAINGVTAIRKGKGTIRIQSPIVVLATGSYGADRSKLPSSMKGVLFYGSEQEKGEGLKLAKSKGAVSLNEKIYKIFPNGVELEAGKAIVTTAPAGLVTRLKGAFLVNRDGQRVINENTSLEGITEKTLSQPDRTLYLVLDEPAFNLFEKKMLLDHLVPSKEALDNWLTVKNNGRPIMVKADTLEQAAGLMGINTDGLLQTADQWRDGIDKGMDKQFERKELHTFSKNGPFYIIEQKPRYATGLGGLKVNKNLQVLGNKDVPIKGLYAVGVVVGGYSSQASSLPLRTNWAIVSAFKASDEINSQLGKVASN